MKLLRPAGLALLAALAVTAAGGAGGAIAAGSRASGLPQAAAASRVRAPEWPGVVVVETQLGYGNGAAAGTGMVLTAAGELLTNNHVIRGATTIRVVDPQTGRTYTARVLGYDVAADVGVLKLQGASGLRTVSTADSSKLRVGQAVTAVGNARGSGTLTAAAGTISGLGRTITAGGGQGGAQQLAGLIETNAMLEPGDSGGPLLNTLGQVIGVDAAASAGFVFQSTGSDGYAIPINRALSIARQIASGRASAAVHIGATAFLGVQLEPSGAFPGGTLAAGEAVIGVVPGSPSERAGLVPGDVVTSLDGRPVASPEAVVALLLRKSPGSRARLAWVDQSGRQSTATVTLASGPPQ